MSAQLLKTTGVILDRVASGESHTRLTALCATHGLLVCMQRISKRGPGKTPILDLFDEVQLDLESGNQGKTWFIRDALPVTKRTALGAAYETLAQACRFARVLADNPAHEESRAAIYALLARALDALEAGGRADAIYFKSLYLLARDEGYPVREDWRAKLDPADRGLVGAVLRQPSENQDTPVGTVTRMTRALEDYLRHETPLHIRG